MEENNTNEQPTYRMYTSTEKNKKQPGFFKNAFSASINSPKLWGGTEVAIPTEIPSAPFNRKFGTFTGNTKGSLSVSSKFGPKTTTFLSKSAR